MALGDETPSVGRHRTPPRPSTRVDKDSSLDIAKSFDVFTNEMRALNATMTNMRKDLQANLDARARFAAPGQGDQIRGTRDKVRADRPSENYDTLAGIVQDAMASQNWESYNRRMGNEQVPGQSRGPGFQYNVNPSRPLGMTDAMQSMGHFQAWTAQRLGQRIAGPNRDVLHPSLDAPPRGMPSSRPSDYTGRRRAPSGDPTAGQPKSTPGPSEEYTGRHERPEYSPRHARPYEPQHAGPEEEDQNQIGMGASAAIAGRLGSALAQSGGTRAGMGAALRRIPYVGIAIEAVSQGRDFYLDQREQARGYQEMTGTGALEGWTDKRREDLYALANLFTYSGDRARSQFQTATALGYNDVGGSGGTFNMSRGSALNFMDEAYHQIGMDTDESGNMLDLASRNTQTNLSQLVRQLDRLSESAGQAGINAMKARENFMQVFDFTTQRGYGAAASGAAEIATNTQISYGKTFEDTDMSGIYSQQAMMLVSGQQGISYGDAQGLLRNDPAAYATATGERFEEYLRNQRPDLVSAIRSATAGEDISNVNVRNRIKEELIGPGGQFENVDLETTAQAMSELTGIPMNREQLLDAAIAELGGSGLGAQAEEFAERQGRNEVTSVTDTISQGGGSSVSENAMANDKVLGNLSDSELDAAWDDAQNGGMFPGKEGSAARSYLQSLRHHMGYSYEAQTGGDKTPKDHLVESYMNQYAYAGNQDPFLEELIANTQGDPEVEIQTADGKSVVMTLSEAIKQGYGDLIASGTVRFVGEEMGGQTTADVAGMQGRSGGPEAADQNSADILEESRGATSFEEWSQNYKGDPYGGFSGSQTTSNGVTIGLAPEAQRLFQFMESDPNAAAMEGSPTSMSDLDSSRYPTRQPN